MQNVVYVTGPHKRMALALAALLDTYGIRVEYHADGAGILEALSTASIEHSCLLLEFDSVDSDSLSLLRRLAEASPELPIIGLGTDIDDDQRRQVRDAGARDIIEHTLAAAYLFTRLDAVIPGASNLPQTAASTMELDDGTSVTFRMMQPEDADMEQAFVVGLSERSRYLRFFSGLEKLPQSVLEDFTRPEYPFSYAVIATIPVDGEEFQIGVARYAPTGTKGVAEFAVVVTDDWQGRGVASKLMRLLITAATVGGLQRLEGLILKQNAPMLAMVEKMGFTLCPGHDADPTVSLYALELRGAADAQSGGEASAPP